MLTSLQEAGYYTGVASVVVLHAHDVVPVSNQTHLSNPLLHDVMALYLL